jgi:hypothetical protein
MTKPPRKVAKGVDAKKCGPTFEQLLECIDLPTGHFKRVKNRRVTLDIDFEDNCC